VHKKIHIDTFFVTLRIPYNCSTTTILPTYSFDMLFLMRSQVPLRSLMKAALISGSLPQEELLIGVHCEKRYINVQGRPVRVKHDA